MELIKYLQERKKLIDEELDRYLPQPDEAPETLCEAMRYSVFAGGKRLRPILVMAAAEAVGKDKELVLPTACALEFIHTYSLIHDDLPAMDDDDLRRGKPTCHKVYGEAMAILAGDALLTRAFEVISKNREVPGVDDAAVVRVIQIVAHGAGCSGMVGGQVADLEAEGKTADKDTMLYIHANKTGALFKAALCAGAVLAGADEEAIAALERYGEQFGLAFQITDDILDVEGKTELIGKPVGSDTKNQKATYPSIYGLEKSYRMAEESVAQAVDALRNFSHKAEPLRQIARYLLTRSY
ncbi:MAG: polyprenyl synthetase family protein [Thermoanaerobacteraceae bacterium]|nr:polyprenyl synthetase family protein [Thermoanaerobacteraceae bacterium]